MKRLERLLKKGFEFYGTMKVASARDMRQRKEMKHDGFRVDHDFACIETPTRKELEQRLLKNGYDNVVFMPPRQGNRHRNVDVYYLPTPYKETDAAR